MEMRRCPVLPCVSVAEQELSPELKDQDALVWLPMPLLHDRAAAPRAASSLWAQCEASEQRRMRFSSKVMQGMCWWQMLERASCCSILLCFPSPRAALVPSPRMDGGMQPL